MRIGVEATCWQNRRGYGRHARSLLGALLELDQDGHYTFYLDSRDASDSLPAAATIRFIRASSPAAVAASSDGHRSFRDIWRMSRTLSAAAVDVLLFPTVYTYVPVVSRARKVVMIHDVIAETFPELTLPSRTARLFWGAKVALGRRQADAVATVSEYSRRALIERFNLPPERVFVVGEASDPVFRRLDQPQLSTRLAELGVPSSGQLIAYVGGFGPHKNLLALLETFATLAGSNKHADRRLVMVGEYRNEVFHSYYETLRRRCEQLGIADRVIFTGYLPDDELVVLLNLTTLLVLPSLMEGFGLPAIEAAACGCPVVATSASPLPELLGEGGVYVDPTRPEDLRTALDRVLDSERLRQKMGQAGLAAASRLTWRAAAGQLKRLLEQVAAR